VGTLVANADVLLKHDEISMGLGLLREALNKNSFHKGATKKIISTLLEQENYQEAYNVASAILAKDRTFENLFNLAHINYQIKKDSEAFDQYLECLQLVVAQEPELFEIFKNLGNILVRASDFEGAEEYYNKAYILNPNSDLLFVNFGTLEAQKGDFNKSKDHLSKALEINPQNDKAWVGLALVHSHFGDHEIAWANIECALEVNSKNKTAVHLAATWSVRDAQVDKGLGIVLNYLEQENFDEEISMILVHMLCLKKSYQLALLEVEKTLCWNPQSTEFKNLYEQLKNQI
jgi:tetratricopeptide (TPR) repeat protein